MYIKYCILRSNFVNYLVTQNTFDCYIYKQNKLNQITDVELIIRTS